MRVLKMPLTESEKKLMNTTKTNVTADLPPAVGQRRYDRISFPARVQIISHGVFGDRSYGGMCTDISLDGVAFETDAKLFLQNMVELVFEIENKIIFRDIRQIQTDNL